jgi:hypothetical protein
MLLMIQRSAMITQTRLQHFSATLTNHYPAAAPSVMYTCPTTAALLVLLALMTELGQVDRAFATPAVALLVVRHG